MLNARTLVPRLELPCSMYVRGTLDRDVCGASLICENKHQ